MADTWRGKLVSEMTDDEVREMAGAPAGDVGPQALEHATEAAHAELSARFPHADSLLLEQAARAAVLAAFGAAGIRVEETNVPAE